MSINVPPSTSIVSVSVIDTTCDLKSAPAAPFFGPSIPGFETWSAPAWAFLITNTDNSTGEIRRLVFDLGPPRDWEHDLPPPYVQGVSQWVKGGTKINITKYTSEILAENNVDLNTINAIILSHLHWDHQGKPSLFANSTELLIGPGAKAAFGPGFPHKQSSPIMARELEGRKVTEPSFSSSDLSIGGLNAIDYFGDGSFYLLDAPGHMIGHLNALARTSCNPDTFIYMGADSFHHGSVLKPNEYTHLPSSIDLGSVSSGIFPSSCPGELFHSMHPSHPSRHPDEQPDYAAAINQGSPDSTPFLTLSRQADGKSLAHDYDAGRATVEKIKVFDADERVFVVIAHDNSLRDVLEFFPKSANEWKEKGWKEQGRWRFLKDFEKAVEISQGKS